MLRDGRRTHDLPPAYTRSGWFASMPESTTATVTCMAHSNAQRQYSTEQRVIGMMPQPCALQLRSAALDLDQRLFLLKAQHLLWWLVLEITQQCLET
jgi:hypothetical protein